MNFYSNIYKSDLRDEAIMTPSLLLFSPVFNFSAYDVVKMGYYAPKSVTWLYSRP